MTKKKKRKRRFSDVLAACIMIVAIGIFLYAAYQLYLIFSEYHKGAEEYDFLREYVDLLSDDTDERDDDPDETKDARSTKEIIAANEIPPCPVSVDFPALKEINPDLVGWIYVEAIPKISYPIVQGQDNNYYLKHTFEGVANSSASIFLDYRNHPDYSDSNTIIYGHNMKNQSMFGLLKQMKQPEIFEKSPYIWIVTEEEEICYEVFSVRDIPETDALYHLFEEAPELFLPQLEQYKQDSLVDSPVTFDGTEQIITLSTCTGNDTVRCVVQAVRKDF